MNLRGYYIEN